MSVSAGKLVTQINSKILSGGQDAINTARLVGSVEALESRYSVANLAALPAAADNTGRFIYVEDLCAYRYSDGTQWTNDYDTTLSVTSGQLWAWGVNSCGNLGDGTTTNHCSPVREFSSATDWSQVSSGQAHTSAIKTNGELWLWGQNSLYQLGDGTAMNRCSPVREFCSATNWRQVSSGASHTSALKTSGEIWSWGINSAGRLGDGTATNRCSPVREFCSATNWCQVSAGGSNAAAIKTSGELWVWGANYGGRLGDGTATNRCSPVREFCSATNWCQVSAGNAQISAIKTSGELWGWGLNSPTFNTGAIGDGTTTNRCSPVREFCSATDWCQVSAGSITSAVKTSGELWSWGRNLYGGLGNGTTISSCSPVREFCSATNWCQVTTASLNSAAVKTTGQIWSWGYNCAGRLGDGTTVNKCSPVREISSSTDWCQVSVGISHTAAVKITKGFNES
jgi:alpha-tubulin suppressor-like RCC1 family protein